MITGNPKTRFSKTDFCRFLNEHSDRIPSLVKYWESYAEKCARARRDKASQFGFWIRANKPAIFERLYKKAAKNGAELLAETYGEDGKE